MKTIEQIMQPMTGAGVIEALKEVMRKDYPEFAASIPKHEAAITALRHALPADAKPSVDDYIAAHEQDVISRVVSAGYLGFRVNLEHFHHPVQIDFVRLDTIDYLKDHIIGHFPQNYEAYDVMHKFREAWQEQYDELIELVDDYYVFMELTGPKLAHYAGYVIANHLLPWVEPGYRPDYSQTMRFAEETKKYNGFLPL